MPPKLNRKRALFVLTKIDEILAWERQKEAERDTRFVELGRYLCEVRAGQYWRLENLKSFDEFLARRFPESRRKAYYLMSIHEHLPPQVRKDLKEVGWTKGLELAKLARRDGQHFDCATWLHKARALPKEDFRRAVEKELTGREEEPSELIYFKVYKSQIPVIEQAIETAALMLGTDKSPTSLQERTWTMATRRSCSTRSHATTGSCPANSSRLSSKACVRRHRDRLPAKTPRLRLDQELCEQAASRRRRLSPTCYLLAWRIEKLQYVRRFRRRQK
jgi:hypothetical protein